MTLRIRTAPRWLGPTMLIAFALLASSCSIFKPDESPEPPPPPFRYPSLSTPDSVILNVKYAWERKDSLRTKLIYDAGYQGSSTDNDGTTTTFTKDQEAEAVWNIGRSQNVTGVSFNLQSQDTWIRLSYPTDPAGWTAIQLPGVNIQVDDNVNGTQVANTSNFFEFKFVPTLDAASPTDTTWKIIRWTEIRN